MADAHERYEELALGHVLGGLPTAAAAEFRAHLVDCRDCRSRVSELRDIAAELAATEREERRLAAVATQQVVRRVDFETDEDGPPHQRPISRWLRLITPVAIIMVVFLAFLTFHWQRVGQYALDVNRRQALVMTVLASGELIPVSELAPGVHGMVARDGDTLAFNLVDVRPIEDGEVVVAWLFAADDVDVEPLPTPPDDGSVAFVLDDVDDDVTRVVVSIESSERSNVEPLEPAGLVVVEVQLGG